MNLSQYKDNYDRIFNKGENTTEYKTEIIQQLWECLRRGYTYEEAQIHMRAYKEGKTTEKKVIVVEKQED